MKINDLESAIGGNCIGKHSVSAAEISNIMRYADVSLEMDRDSLDLFYSITVDELLSSDMPLSDLDDMKKQGWSFTEDKRHIIVYI